MLHFSSIPEPSAVEPVAVMSGAGAVTVPLVGDAGQVVTLRMEEASALLLAALLTPTGTPKGGMAAAGAA